MKGLGWAPTMPLGLKDPRMAASQAGTDLEEAVRDPGTLPTSGIQVLHPIVRPSDQLGSGATVGCVQPWGPHPLEAVHGEW